jgi:SAM-dependent methyltransferase
MPRPVPRRGKPRFTARTADRHELYQLSVQAPERDARFLSRYVLKTTGRPLRRFREDFCGTALLACWFVKLHRDNHAVGVDLHWPTLAWGRIHNVARLLDRDQQQRLRLRRADVRAVRAPRVQAIAALNFSYSVFQTRAALRRYFDACFRALEPGGLLFVDAWGGPDVQTHATDRTRHHGFDYLWEQRAFDPITHHIECAIHFAFRDGTRLHDAFVYDWRLWTMPELRELMAEAGFTDVHVLWEGTDGATRSGNGVFRRKEVGDADPAWIVYVVGRRPARR